MKKVAFSISNVRSKSDKKISGFGYLSEGTNSCILRNFVINCM